MQDLAKHGRQYTEREWVAQAMQDWLIELADDRNLSPDVSVALPDMLALADRVITAVDGYRSGRVPRAP